MKITATLTTPTRALLTLEPNWLEWLFGKRRRLLIAFVGDCLKGGQSWFLRSGRECSAAMLDAIDGGNV